MYSEQRLSASLDGIDSFQFSSYWAAIKDKIADLRNLPTWTTNHAMKLGLAVSRMEKAGRQDVIATLQDEIRKVNDDIAKAWKVKGYIDKYLPDWVKQDAAVKVSGAPIIVSPTGIAVDPSELTARPTTMPPAYVAPTLSQEITGWIKGWFGGGGVQGLGILPLAFILAPAAMAGLAYVVTTGMALYQDYITKQTLTQAVIEGKLASGQAADILVASRPKEGVFANILTGVGTNVGTLAVVGIVGYLGFMYMTTKK